MSVKRTSAAEGIRLSASLIMVNLRNEVLLVRRNPKSNAFGGFHVSKNESSNTAHLVNSLKPFGYLGSC